MSLLRPPHFVLRLASIDIAGKPVSGLLFHLVTRCTGFPVSSVLVTVNATSNTIDIDMLLTISLKTNSAIGERHMLAH